MKCVSGFLIFLFTIFSVPSYSTSFIVKFKNSDSKRKFEHTIKNSPTLIFQNIPVQKSIEYILNKSDLVLANEAAKSLKQFNLVGILKVDNNIDNRYLDKLLTTDGIEYWEPNYTFSIEENRIKDGLIREQWYLDAINVHNAWKISMGEGVLIGFVDTGLEFYHREFSNSLWVNPGEDRNGNGTFEPWWDTVSINGAFGDFNGIDDDGNGFIDDLIGYDFVSQIVANFGDYFEPDPIPEDEHGHGTLVAGVLAAGINDTGIVGVAPKAKLVVLRAFDLTGNAELKDIVSAIIYAALNRINVLNLSFGTSFDSRLLHEAIKFANEMGCIIVASAGNDGQIIKHFPSDYPEVISVGATTKNGFIGQSSNYGPRVDIFAPGFEILSTTIGNKYKLVSGTSFSAPIVSGAVAL
ncbi:MAG: S8 family serine peptidase, partial [Candidatus Kapaibacteriota bacterium]